MSCKVPVAKVGPELDSAIIKGVNLIGAAAATERGEQELTPAVALLAP